jgi:hypothetical protein
MHVQETLNRRSECVERLLASPDAVLAIIASWSHANSAGRVCRYLVGGPGAAGSSIIALKIFST